MTAPDQHHGPGRLTAQARTLAAAARPCLAVVAAAGVAGLLAPPAASYARQYAWFQAVQFAVFAVAAPALLVLGLPSRSRRPPPVKGWPPASRAITRLTLFIVAVIAWRLPAALNMLATSPGLVLAEMVTLVAAGAGVWLELTDRTAGNSLIRPGRAAVAALSMWTIWIIGYITGMSRASWPSEYRDPAVRAIGIAADQQIGVAILWAVPAVCFAPLIYALLITWLGERYDPDRELREASESRTAPGGLPRPPRGWRSP